MVPGGRYSDLDLMGVCGEYPLPPGGLASLILEIRPINTDCPLPFLQMAPHCLPCKIKGAIQCQGYQGPSRVNLFMITINFIGGSYLSASRASRSAVPFMHAHVLFYNKMLCQRYASKSRTVFFFIYGLCFILIILLVVYTVTICWMISN